jgi:hypothetical protein
MVPTPLQALPLSQRPAGAFSQATEKFWPLPAPPQHWEVALQESPVTRQPPATAHTGTPEPRSRHTLVQQVVGPLGQGTPSWLQLLVPPEPPVSWHRPAVEPPGISQTALQQSTLAWQMSP